MCTVSVVCEQIPKCFKHGVIIPAFKGKGSDPLVKKNYKGITLTSVIAKVFEIILTERISPILEDSGIPQITQTAYRKGVSCQDSIIASQEANEKFTSDGDSVYTCFYDLASAFDTIEFSVLLEDLFNAGIRVKSWRLIKDWYCGLVSQVRLGNHLSSSFNISQGIHQGSVLSPLLCNLVIDPLLFNLKHRNLGLSVNGLFLGAFAHADDIRSSATNIEDSAEQVAIVDRFTSSKSLKLAPEKCALLSTNNINIPSTNFSIRIGETCLPMEKSVKCLGVWWDSSSSSKLSIRERINKARSAFFSHGQLGAFQGSLNPHLVVLWNVVYYQSSCMVLNPGY